MAAPKALKCVQGLPAGDLYEVQKNILEWTRQPLDKLLPGKASRVFHVAQGLEDYPKDAGVYSKPSEAIEAINKSERPSANNRCVVLIWPGKYTEDTLIKVPKWVGIKGVEKGLVQLQNDTTDMFQFHNSAGPGGNWVEGLIIEGSAKPGLYAFDCNNASDIHIRNVDMLNNGGASRQKFLKQSGATWTRLCLERIVADGYHTSGYLCKITNTSGTARVVDCWINDVFFDAFHLTTFGGSFQLQGVQDVRISRSTIRGVAVNNTSVRHENGGVAAASTCKLDVWQCYMAGGVPLFGDAGTDMQIINTDAVGSLLGAASGGYPAGTRTLRNSSV